jgi:O-antigen ligase
MKLGFVRGVPILVLLIVFLMSPMGDSVMERLMSTSSEGKVDLSTLGRFAAWYTASEIFKLEPFFGVGQAQFQDFMKTIFPPNLFTLGSVFTLRHAHNGFFSILAETGLWGVAHVFTLLFFVVKSIRRSVNIENGMKGVLLLNLIIMIGLGLLDNIPFHDGFLFMGIWLLSIYLFNYEKKYPGTSKVSEIK